MNGDTTEPWPHETILLFRYSTIEEPDEASHWMRQDNEPKSPGIDKMHAEFKMIKILKTLNSISRIEVILNYSPCSDCSEKLCSLKRDLDKEYKQSKNIEREMKAIDSMIKGTEDLSLNPGDKEEDKIEFKITFSYFYRVYTGMSGTGINKHSQGIINLFKNEIKLEILTYDKWQYFFKETGLLHEREKREWEVKSFLDALQEQASDEVWKLPLFSLKLQTNKLNINFMIYMNQLLKVQRGHLWCYYDFINIYKENLCI